MLIAAALIGISVWLLFSPSTHARLIRVVGSDQSTGAASPESATRWAWPAAILAAGGAWLLIGGALGAVAAVGAVVALPRLLSRLESRSAREQREAWARQAPLLADLLAATLAAGATVRDAVQVAGEAVGSPTAEALRPVVASIDLGADPATAWRTVGSADAHAVIVEALARAQDSGAPIAVLLTRAADDLRRERRREVEVAARSAGVRAVAPLAACFLPAFLLVGVVPVIASLATGLIGN